MNYGSRHQPEEIRVQSRERQVVISWDGGEVFTYPMEYLRVMCPCANCRGHHPSQRKIIDGKRAVLLEEALPSGNYAVKLAFDDTHDTGIYDWDLLHDLGEHREAYWQEYLAELTASGKNRDDCTLPRPACGHQH